jgi:hypothetical protein
MRGARLRVLQRVSDSGFPTLLVSGAQRVSKRHAIDIAEAVERTVHTASEFLVRGGALVLIDGPKLTGFDQTPFSL